MTERDKKHPSTSGTYRAQQTTLVDEGERPSLAAFKSTEKNRSNLTVLTGPAKGLVYKLEGRVLTLGRGEDADLSVPDPSLSRIHACLVEKKDERTAYYTIEDCGSTNGTYVNEQRVKEPVSLTDGLRIGLGRRTFMRFSVQDALEEFALLRMQDSALHDPLTRAYNRRVFQDRLTSEYAFAARHDRPLALLFLDIDYFKQFNDTFGHQAGDRVLQEIARQVAATLRVEDVFARYGGEEFAILARDTPPHEALVLAERVRRLVELAEVSWAGQRLNVTASVGIACCTHDTKTPEQLVQRADLALYRAKAEGRNRYAVFEATQHQVG